MGLIADFIVATPENALEYDSFLGRPLPPDRFQRAEYKNFTSLALGFLWATLRDEQWDVKRHELETVRIKDGGESWLFRFPEELVRLIASMDDKMLVRIADAWVSPEVPGESEELVPVLRDLKRLAIHAQNSGRGLYLWGSV